MLNFPAFHLSIYSCCLLNYVALEKDLNIPAVAKYFNTKGRYEEVNPYLREDVLAVNTSIVLPPSDQCEARYLTAIIRHGTRYPTTKDIQEMQKLYNMVLQNATGEESWLREIRTQWRMWYMEDMDGRLVQKGVDELKHLAVRLSKLFPGLISEEKLRGGLIKFITSSKHRCVNSTLSFKAGLTGLWGVEDVEFDHEVNDTLMRFFAECPRLKQDVDNSPSAVQEVMKFKEGAEMKKVQQKIAGHLGVRNSLITYNVAEAAFHLCAYEFAIKEANSPWCQLFDEEDAKVMEYASDLREFWKRGYGHDINSKASCGLLHHVFNQLDQAATRNRQTQTLTGPAATVQVGHADTLLPLLTLLGFFKDTTPLTSVNYAKHSHRSFRTSHMMPYAANLVFVLYDCGINEPKLQLLLNEKPVTFPGLTHLQASMPRYQDVKDHYMGLLQDCDFKTECELKHPTDT
ncbi:unnamed protein product [Ophioblennius macclurei]